MEMSGSHSFSVLERGCGRGGVELTYKWSSFHSRAVLSLIILFFTAGGELLGLFKVLRS